MPIYVIVWHISSRAGEAEGYLALAILPTRAQSLDATFASCTAQEQIIYLKTAVRV